MAKYKLVSVRDVRTESRERDLTSRQIVKAEAALLRANVEESKAAEIVESLSRVDLVVRIGQRTVTANSLAGQLARAGVALEAIRQTAKQPLSKRTIAALLAMSPEEREELRALVAEKRAEKRAEKAAA
jgi:DNA-directed RNA polymerase subunit F